MKKIIILYSVLIFLIGCKKKNEYFATNEIYNTVIHSINEIHNGISKTDKVFYVFNRYDTLIVMSSEYENILQPTQTIKREGYFRYKKNKIIITEPYKPTFQILKEKIISHPSKSIKEDTLIMMVKISKRE